MKRLRNRFDQDIMMTPSVGKKLLSIYRWLAAGDKIITREPTNIPTIPNHCLTVNFPFFRMHKRRIAPPIEIEKASLQAPVRTLKTAYKEKCK